MSRTDKHNPFSFCAYGVSCRARAERVRYAGTSGDSPPGAWVGSNGFPALQRQGRPETRLGFYVRAAAYNTRGTNVFIKLLRLVRALALALQPERPPRAAGVPAREDALTGQVPN